MAPTPRLNYVSNLWVQVKPDQTIETGKQMLSHRVSSDSNGTLQKTIIHLLTNLSDLLTKIKVDAEQHKHF